MVSSIQTQISENRSKTWFIMGFFILFITMVGLVLGKGLGYGNAWILPAVVFSSVMTLVSYYWGDRFIMGVSGAKEAKPADYPLLFRVVERLSKKDNFPEPMVYVIEENAPNAFATGRDPDHSSICVTIGLLNTLNEGELEGVLAHELSHIQNYDTRLMAIVSLLVGIVAIFSDWFMRSLFWGRRDNRDEGGAGAIIVVVGIIFAILSPIIATLIQLAISRRREFLADASGAYLTQHPAYLASALEKISVDKHVLRAASSATAHLYIVNPFKDKNAVVWFSSLFNTHPPIEERIKILRSM